MLRIRDLRVVEAVRLKLRFETGAGFEALGFRWPLEQSRCCLRSHNDLGWWEVILLQLSGLLQRDSKRARLWRICPFYNIG